MSFNPFKSVRDWYQSGKRWSPSGWVTEKSDPDGSSYLSFCLDGALSVILTGQEDLAVEKGIGSGDRTPYSARDRLASTIAELFPERATYTPGSSPLGTIMSFNDSDSTSYEDVNKVLSKAADDWDEYVATYGNGFVTTPLDADLPFTWKKDGLNDLQYAHDHHAKDESLVDPLWR